MDAAVQFVLQCAPQTAALLILTATGTATGILAKMSTALVHVHYPKAAFIPETLYVFWACGGPILALALPANPTLATLAQLGVVVAVFAGYIGRKYNRQVSRFVEQLVDVEEPNPFFELLERAWIEIKVIYRQSKRAVLQVGPNLRNWMFDLDEPLNPYRTGTMGNA